MTRYLVHQRWVSTLAYIVEADSEVDALALVQGGQVYVDHDFDSGVEWAKVTALPYTRHDDTID